MSSELSKLRERLTRLERWRHRVDDVLALLPESIDPLTWKGLDYLDKAILQLLLTTNKPYSTSEMAHKIRNVHRTKVWRHMKRIQRLSKKLKGDFIVVFDPSSKKWSLNTEEFTFKQLESMNSG